MPSDNNPTISSFLGFLILFGSVILLICFLIEDGSQKVKSNECGVDNCYMPTNIHYNEKTLNDAVKNEIELLNEIKISAKIHLEHIKHTTE